MFLLVSALILLSSYDFCNCEEDADELDRVKSTLRDCRSDLNNLEISKDRCSESQRELKNKIKELQNKISQNDHEHLLLVGYYTFYGCNVFFDVLLYCRMSPNRSISGFTVSVIFQCPTVDLLIN